MLQNVVVTIERKHNSVALCEANNDSNIYVETEVGSHDLSLCPKPIIENEHSFPDAYEFRNALYVSLVDRFHYKFKKEFFEANIYMLFNGRVPFENNCSFNRHNQNFKGSYLPQCAQSLCRC